MTHSEYDQKLMKTYKLKSYIQGVFWMTFMAGLFAIILMGPIY